MIKGIFITKEEIDNIQTLLEQIDIEIGSTMVFYTDPTTVRTNMIQANKSLKSLKHFLEIEF